MCVCTIIHVYSHELIGHAHLKRLFPLTRLQYLLRWLQRFLCSSRVSFNRRSFSKRRKPRLPCRRDHVHSIYRRLNLLAWKWVDIDTRVQITII